MKERMPLSYHDLDLDYLTSEDLNIIEIKAKALSLDECFEYLCIKEDEIPERELSYAKIVFRKGRVKAISEACDRMFSTMNHKNGAQVAFDYLKQLSSTFALAPVKSTGSGFSFNVILPEDPKK